MSTACKHVPSSVASSMPGQAYYERSCTKCDAVQRATIQDDKFIWSARWRGGTPRRVVPAAVRVSVTLTSSSRVQVKLSVSHVGEIEVFSRDAGTHHCIETRQRVVGKDVQEFYEQLLVQLGYEVPRVKLREIFKCRLRVRRSEHLVRGRVHTQYDLTCLIADLYVGVPLPGALVPIRASFGQRRALELCRALAEPLGWELTE